MTPRIPSAGVHARPHGVSPKFAYITIKGHDHRFVIMALTCIFLVVLTASLSKKSAQLRALLAAVEGALPAPDRKPIDLPLVQRQLTSAEVAEVVRLYVAGLTLKELGVQFELHRTTIRRVLRDAEVRVRRQAITAEQIAEAAQLYAEGWSLARLGERLGLPAESIRRALIASGVVMRTRWKR